jgi:P27 family predicted phage terminase small subunit
VGGPGSGRRKAPGRAPGGELVPVAPGAELPRTAPRAPAGLSAGSRRLWRELWQEAAWVRPGVDRVSAELLCRMADDIAALAVQVAADGKMIPGSKGQMVAHPLIAEIRKHRAALGELAGQMGLRPDMRARLGLTVAKASALDELAAKRRERTGSRPAAAAAVTTDREW